MLKSTFNNHPVTFDFSPSEGLTVSPSYGDPPTTISTSSLVCVRPDEEPDSYTLIQQVTPTELICTPITNPPAALLDKYLLRKLPPHLDPKLSDVTIIVSSASGGGAAAAFYENTVAPLCAALELSPTVIRTTSPTTISETVAQASSKAGGKQSTILLLGGDTAVHEAINAARAPVTLAIFPLGTGNALANSYHVVRGRSPVYSLLFGTPKLLPTFTATFSAGAKWVHGAAADPVRGAVVLSWGFHASLVADAETLRGEGVGTERFQTAAGENLKPPLHRYTGKISFLDSDGNWEVVGEENHFYATATLCSNLEEKFCISPKSVPGEMRLRLVYFKCLESGEEVMDLMMAAYAKGKHVERDEVRYEAVKGVRIEIHEKEEKWRRVCVDGGIAVLPEGGQVEVKMDEKEVVKLVWAD
ncbi:ATP-NAD kinase-like domain-containing protein [Sphaerosporella brunnea]|uniref:ATP-NAD kinase-like domain-containing protein n=1 Tax=Sphaerosporella brunnea TaxID=1250544 RepID=A0A5J5ERH5_9PEZI|nr:ATP-NAD kinase-like domain-containing protein [Sphaerosporella brunnea]